MLFHTNLLALLLVASHSSTFVDAHACLTSPPSRQWYSYTDGKAPWQGDEAIGYPVRRYGPYGYQAGGYTYGPCGRKRAGDDVNDFTNNYVDAFGGPVPFTPQAEYVQGQVIEIEVTTTANHQGYFEFFVCSSSSTTDIDNPTQECFDEHPLTFVRDLNNGATVQAEYPTRGYMAPSGATDKVKNESGYQVLRHEYKLPDDIVGDKVLLQWQWISFLGCKAEGSQDYNFPAHWNTNHYFGNMCTPSYDDLGRLPSSGNAPQHYWQCSEVSIFPPAAPSSSQMTLAPVVHEDDTTTALVSVAPVTVPSAPVTAAPVTVPSAPIVSVTLAPIVAEDPSDEEPCGQCGSAPGQNQSECDNQEEERCLTMIANENKCAWTACENAPGPTLSPCGQCGAAPGANQPECNDQTADKCLEMIDNEGKCSWSPCNN